MNIRETIQVLRVEIGDAKGLTPGRAAEILVDLSNLVGNIIDEIRACESLYNHKLQECFEVEKASNRAKLRAQNTREYERLREQKDLKEIVVDLQRSLKYLIRSYEEEKHGYR